MRGRVERAYAGARAVGREIRREDVTFMAASIAYHAFVSMLPILLLLTLVASAFGGEEFAAGATAIAAAFLPETGRRVVTDTVRNATGNVGISAIGLLVLLWGTSKVFRAMDAAFAEIYDTERKVSLLDQFRDAVVVVLALAVAAFGAIVLGTVVEIPGTIPFSGVLEGLVGVLGLAVAFLPIYYVFPNAAVSMREVLPGVVVAAVGWATLEWLFGLYVSFSARPDVYGLIGTLVLLVTWLYVGGLVLLVGAAVNATIAGRNTERRSEWRGKRRFGRQVTDGERFADGLDELIATARDAGVPAAAVRRVLLRRAAAIAADGDGRATGADESGEDEAATDRD